MTRIDIKIVCEAISVEREIIERSNEIILKMMQRRIIFPRGKSKSLIFFCISFTLIFFSIFPCIALPTIVIVIVVAHLQSKRQKLKKRHLAISLKSEKEQQLLLSQ